MFSITNASHPTGSNLIRWNIKALSSVQNVYAVLFFYRVLVEKKNGEINRFLEFFLDI